MRDTNFVARLQDELKRCEDPNNFVPTSSLFVMDTGSQTTFTGTGQALQNFKDNVKIEYSGSASKVVNFFDINFDEADLRYLKFDESFHTAPRKDCRSSK